MLPVAVVGVDVTGLDDPCHVSQRYTGSSMPDRLRARAISDAGSAAPDADLEDRARNVAQLADQAPELVAAPDVHEVLRCTAW